MYKFGTIVLIPFPFTDLSSSKLRPALIISKENNTEDIIVAFISSKVETKPNSIILQKTDVIFKHTGLKTNSTLRFDKIATLEKKTVLGELGKLPKDFFEKHKATFFGVFGF